MTTVKVYVPRETSSVSVGANEVAVAIAREAGNGKAVNMVMVGTVMKHLPFKEEVITEVVRQISQNKGVEVNLKALAGGAEA